MCPRKVEDRIEALDRKLNTVLARMTYVKEENEVWKLEKHYEEVEKVWEILDRTNQKLEFVSFLNNPGFETVFKSFFAFS